MSMCAYEYDEGFRIPKSLWKQDMDVWREESDSRGNTRSSRVNMRMQVIKLYLSLDVSSDIDIR